MITLCAIYIFVPIDDVHLLQKKLRALCENYTIQGTLLIAEEGLNGTIAGSDENIRIFLEKLQKDKRFNTCEIKKSYAKIMPFHRMKIRIKKEIVTLGISGIDPVKQRGTYVSAEQWNDLLDDPDTLVIDTRNDYEVAIGSFEGAIHPNTKNFTEFPDFVKNHLNPQLHKKIAMFCTGGIRCEKSTSYLKQQGFENVYHLQGGILKYLEKIPQEQSKWHGECFVFDDRTAVTHTLAPSNYTFCRSCRTPLSPQDTLHTHYAEGIHCANCYPHLSPKKKAAAAQRHHQMQLAKKYGIAHLGFQKNEKNKIS